MQPTSTDDKVVVAAPCAELGHFIARLVVEGVHPALKPSSIQSKDANLAEML